MLFYANAISRMLCVVQDSESSHNMGSHACLMRRSVSRTLIVQFDLHAVFTYW